MSLIKLLKQQNMIKCSIATLRCFKIHTKTDHMFGLIWVEIVCVGLRPNKKISVFRETGLKILGRVGIHNFFNYYFS